MIACCNLVCTCLKLSLVVAQEYVNGQLKNKYGDAFIRGNNGKQLMHFCLMTCAAVTTLPLQAEAANVSLCMQCCISAL